MFINHYLSQKKHLILRRITSTACAATVALSNSAGLANDYLPPKDKNKKTNHISSASTSSLDRLLVLIIEEYEKRGLNGRLKDVADYILNRSSVNPGSRQNAQPQRLDEKPISTESAPPEKPKDNKQEKKESYVYISLEERIRKVIKDPQDEAAIKSLIKYFPGSEYSEESAAEWMAKQDPSEGLEIAALIFAKYATQKGLAKFAGHLGTNPSLRYNWDLIFTLLKQMRSESENKGLARLSRYRLSKPDEKDLASAEYHVAAMAVQISSQSDRNDFLTKALTVLASKNESAIGKLIQPSTHLVPPKGYTLVKRNLGSGKTGIAHVVKDNKTGRLWVWKAPNSDSSHVKRAFEKEIEFTEKWRKVGATSMEILPIKYDGPGPVDYALMKSLIKGHTLKDVIHQNENFFSEDSEERQALIDWLEALIAQGVFIDGLNAENLMYNTALKRWDIIDGNDIETFNYEKEEKRPKRAYQKYREQLPGKWSRDKMGLGDQKAEVIAFLETVLPSAELVSSHSNKDREVIEKDSQDKCQIQL